MDKQEVERSATTETVEDEAGSIAARLPAREFELHIATHTQEQTLCMHVATPCTGAIVFLATLLEHFARSGKYFWVARLSVGAFTVGLLSAIIWQLISFLHMDTSNDSLWLFKPKVAIACFSAAFGGLVLGVSFLAVFSWLSLS